MKKTLFILILPFLAYAAPQQKSAEALSHSISGQKFSAQVKEGHHFNLKAPNQVVADGVAQKKIVLNERKAEFALPAKWAQGQASLYVCDDAVTYCDIHHIPLKGSASAPVKSGSATAANQAKKDSHGFYKDSYEEAFAEAKKLNKMVFIEFSAKWCPGCVRYDKEVFPNAEFKKLTKDYVKLKIDVDQFENFATTEKFGIYGIPTVVVLNADEREIGRIVDFQTKEQLKPHLASFKQDPRPLADLMALAKDSKLDEAENLRLGKRLLAASQNEAALKLLNKVTPLPPEALRAEFEVAKKNFEKDPNTKNQYIETLRTILSKESHTLRSLDWRLELIKQLEPNSDEVKTLTQSGLEAIDKMLKDPKALADGVRYESVGEFKGYEKLLVAMYKPDLLETTKHPEDKVKRAWLEAADIGKGYKISARQSGPAVRYLIVLSAAEKWNEAEAMANQILKVDPNNVDVKRRKIKVLASLNKHKEAVQLAEEILPLAEGRNQFWVAESLAKSYLKLEDKASAKKLLVAFLAKPEIEAKKMASTKKTMESLLKEAQ